ncbi:uncharacterized protein GGS25DRAFT_122363 [Hypoxylon fragiforme]|uniref:uncharacterized protein n=1 Tax=Hypoxylon fragiforme TaxID=63214 RepID=UPI0020C66F8A|nr:uncharacterized protein GGS25DRAFT_122363 [Hypoxylon fragiforme]KAI2612510.1 hypothetical protein GGS25DRAFT_122363 [Hypoxylon fragiforme]
METDHIDKLLERYLHLLHQYTALRGQLSNLQTGMYQNIARANFAAERGMRFGQDHYDERMQATRRITVEPTSSDDGGSSGGGGDQKTVTSGLFTFTVKKGAAEDPEARSPEDPPTHATQPSDTEKAAGNDNAIPGFSGKEGLGKQAGPSSSSSLPRDTKEKKQQKQKQKQKDPIRWFGLLTPLALRQAQAQSIEAVETVIPALVAVGAEMAQVEIEVRRARKRRAKAEATAARQEQEQELVQEQKQEVAV